MAYRTCLRLAAIVLFVCASAQAGTFAVFGPRDYKRATGQPVGEHATFTARNTALTYRLQFQNGGPANAFAQITSAKVTLNGAEIIVPKDFTAKTPALIERAVALAASNELIVEINGDPGAGATLQILGEDNDLPSIVATLAPAPAAGGWNNTDVTVSFACGDATSSVPQCPAPVHLTAQGETIVERTATDAAGNSASTSVTVKIDYEPPQLIFLEEPPARTNESSVHIRGLVSDLSGATVRVNGVNAPVVEDEFSADIPLHEGTNAISVVTTDLAGSTASITGSVERYTIPVVEITTPADLAVVRDASVNVSGTVSTPGAAVRVNGIAATVSGNNFTVHDVPLAQGRTVVTAAATTAAGNTGSASVLIYRDSIPPRVTLHAPADGATVYQSPIDVTGTVDDIVVGTINSGQIAITLNGSPVEVANRAFVAHDFALTPGVNTLTITAVDQGGNSRTLTSHVTYDLAAGQAKIVGLSGNGQSAAIGAELAHPLVVRLVGANGLPVAGQPVSFEIAENNGSLRTQAGTGRTVTATTDAGGQASAFFTLGTRAGAGNNRVVAHAGGFAGSVEFAAAARTGQPAMIVVDSGNTQFGATGAPLPRPLIAVVVDSGSNRLGGVSVTFSSLQGGGTFDGNDTMTVTTDSDGRAIATPTVGQIGTNTYVASVGGVEHPAAFHAFGKLAGPPSETRISGVILDNTDLPLPGVSVRIDGSTLTALTNDQGQFTIAAAPVGYVKLLVDGSTAQRPGTWPTIEYAMYTIPGANNTLEMPIYLLPIDVRRGLFVDEVTGGTLTLPELPGFALTVKPGSATFPGGGRTGTVSVTLVHADKVPMAPGFGQQPRFIVTIQPAGVHFDPPAAISFPNVDGLAPGEVTEMYSFDHDLGQFVSIGTASVSENGAVLRSDAGVGIIKGGWHCGGNPPPGGTPNCCDKCKVCNGTTCVFDPTQNGDNCEKTGPPSPVTIPFQFLGGTYTVTISVSGECGKHCSGFPNNPCALPSNRWGYGYLMSEARYAIDLITNSNCLGPQTRDKAFRSIGNINLNIECANQPNAPGTGPACAWSGVGSNGPVSLTNLPQANCGRPAKQILHEILHTFAGIPHVPGPTNGLDCTADTIAACDQNCFGSSNACGPTNGTMNPLCN